MSKALKIGVFVVAIVFATLFSHPVVAQDAPDSQVAEKPIMINKGNWEIGGEGNYFRSNEGTGLRSITLSPRVEYFILNRFSVGGRLNYIDSNRASTEIQIGPGFSWYPLIIGRTALVVDQAILMINPAGSQQTYFAGDTGLGLDWFVSPSVAIGPSIRGLFYFGGDSARPEGGVGFRIGISVFL